MIKRILTIIVITLTVVFHTPAQMTTVAPKSDAFLQGFYWNSPPGGVWWDSLRSMAPRLASAGFSAVWFPNAVKGAGGSFSMGYDPYDHYDFGEYFQQGTRETRFGSRSELQRAIRAFKDAGIQVFADAVLRHMMGGEQRIPYECIPLLNGQPIVPDSAYMLFNYTNGSGRFKKNAGTFYPNSQSCFVDPLFTQTAPEFRFGEWLDHHKASVRDSLKAWGNYLKQELGFDGFRIDAVKAINPEFAADWLNATNAGGYAVAELWGSTQEIGSWLNIAKNVHGASVSMFDFPLRYTLKDMCNTANGSFWMTNLDNAGLVNAGFSGFDVATFVENHDFDRKGWDGSIDNGHDPVTRDKHLAYAYIMFSEGRPAVFFKDYVDYGVGGTIDTLMWIRRQFLGGNTTKRAGLDPYYMRQDGNTTQSDLEKDIYVARRNGFGNQPGGYLVINDNPTQWIDVYVDTELPIGTKLKDYTGRDVIKTVEGPKPGGTKNRIKLWAPARNFTIYVADTTQSVNNPPVLARHPDQVAYTNSPFRMQLTASDANGQSLGFSITGNPAWLSVSATGMLSGTPALPDTGNSVVIVTVTDPLGLTDKDTIRFSVFKNLPPRLTQIPDASVKATVRFSYQAVGSDPDGDTLRYSLKVAPGWMNVEPLTGLIAGTPSVQDTGVYRITLLVTDGKGAFDSSAFRLTVLKNTDTLIATYGKPTIDGNVLMTSNDWRPEWKIVSDSDTDSYWGPATGLDNELLGLYATWDADSFYIGIDYVINDAYNTLMLYLDAGIAGGITNFNSNQGYAGAYAKNFRFRPADAIDYFIASYYVAKPLLFKIDGNSAEEITPLVNGLRGENARGLEMAIAWNDMYGLGTGQVPPNVELSMVAVVAGGLNYGAGDSAPDNPDINGDAGPDSLIFLVTVKPDTNGNGIPDPTIIITSVEEEKNLQVPGSFALYQNYPNPFNPSTSIQFDIPERSQVRLTVYDITGREMMVLTNREFMPGRHTVTADLGGLSSGVYFYRVQAGSYHQVRKLVLLK